MIDSNVKHKQLGLDIKVYMTVIERDVNTILTKERLDR